MSQIFIAPDYSCFQVEVRYVDYVVMEGYWFHLAIY